MSAPEVVRVDGVSKRFIVRKDNTLKERVIHLGAMGRKHRKVYTAVDDVSISITAGTTVGLLGPNGSGKSTLLKLIGGIVSPSTGTVQTRGRMAALLELGAGFHPDLSGRENVFLNASILGMTRAETERQFDSIVEFSGIGDFIDTQVKFYSSGMFVRLAFAVAIHTDPDVLLVDEVLAVGDEAFQRKCMDKVVQFQAEGRTIIIVSHSAGQIAELCDRAIVLDEGRVIFDGAADEGISVLREALEGRRTGTAVREEVEPSVEVASIRALDPHDGTPLKSLTPGDPLEFEVALTVRSPVTVWETGFSIDTPQGQVVLSTNNVRLARELPPLSPGERLVRYRISDTHLGSGQYYLNAYVLDGDGHNHALGQGAFFAVSKVDENLGTVWADVSIVEVE
ncbi:ABC transporter ATP-binding protein [Microbacterium sp. zg-YB36]|uniref:ABC transporter ATP-binding protein n=1 Tax=Microbacterium sp. zg-YB36 TaxID=2969407 RepID=UPI00214CBAA3|nr:ABC transporter ATP-binding protein [Microbacterium sp. zg-YB36]MDL5352578.1 ABC transporter ATP-binding protein [Microbacterium sp. zg-YB36]